MAGMRVNVDVRGAPLVAAALRVVRDAVQNKVVKEALGVVSRKAAKTVKQAARTGPTGAYKAAVGTKYVSYRKGQVWTYVVGARRGMARPNPRPFGPREFDPVRYGHLIEGGRRPVRPVTARFLRFYPHPKGQELTFTRRTVAGVAGLRPVKKAHDWVAGPGAKMAEAEIIPRLMREAEKAAAKGKTILK